ncbi:MAG: glycine/sarcosine/betaine reductase selenoprotein B family protein [Candidatus Tectimicrobiota bacterium]
MPVDYIPRIQEKYAREGYPSYRWVVNTSAPPWQEFGGSLAQCRLGLVASGGIYLVGQVAFHYKDDTSFRVIPTDVNTADLRVTHFAYDLTDARQDPNVVFPIDSLRALVGEGFLGSLAAHAYTFMGGIYSARRVQEELAPQLTERLRSQGVDAVLFVPV